MPRPCAVCVHESRAAIEQAILNAKAASSIARTFGFMYQSKTGEKPDHKIITRHRDLHMKDAYQVAMKEREVESGVAMAARLRLLDEHVDKVLDRAWQGDPVMVGDVPLLNEDGSEVRRYDLRLVLAAVREGRGNMELLGKLSGRTEADPADGDALRRHLESPEARRLLARLEELASANLDADA